MGWLSIATLNTSARHRGQGGSSHLRRQGLGRKFHHLKQQAAPGVSFRPLKHTTKTSKNHGKSQEIWWININELNGSWTAMAKTDNSTPRSEACEDLDETNKSNADLTWCNHQERWFNHQKLWFHVFLSSKTGEVNNQKVGFKNQKWWDGYTRIIEIGTTTMRIQQSKKNELWIFWAGKDATKINSQIHRKCYSNVYVFVLM